MFIEYPIWVSHNKGNAYMKTPFLYPRLKVIPTSFSDMLCHSPLLLNIGLFVNYNNHHILLYLKSNIKCI